MMKYLAQTLYRYVALVVVIVWCLISPVNAKPFKHQVTGLFMPEREQDLRAVVSTISEIKLISIDFKNAEVVFDYDPAKLVPNGKPDQIVKRLDGILRSASYHTFGIKRLQTIPLERLKLVVIPVEGLDCKACSLAAYESIYKLEGVERATASFRDGRVTALIDPTKTDQATLEAALKKRGVQIKSP